MTGFDLMDQDSRLTTRFWIFTTQFFVIMDPSTTRQKIQINGIINSLLTFK